MRVLLYGGAGYVGSVLAKTLLEKGYEVRLYDRLDFGASPLLPLFMNPVFSLRVGDVRDEEGVEQEAREADFIINLAARVGFPLCGRNPWEALSTNVHGAEVVAAAAFRNQKPLIYVSTQSVYGEQDKNLPALTEATTPNPTSVYSYSKLKAELHTRAIHPKALIFRLGTAFGLSFRMRIDLLLNRFSFDAVKTGHIIVYKPEAKLSFIHVRDIASLISFGIENYDRIQGMTLNACGSDARLTKYEAAQAVASLTKASIVVGEGWRDEDRRDFFLNTEQVESLGWQSRVGLLEGIEEMVRFFRPFKIGEVYDNG